MATRRADRRVRFSPRLAALLATGLCVATGSRLSPPDVRAESAPTPVASPAPTTPAAPIPAAAPTAPTAGTIVVNVLGVSAGEGTIFALLYGQDEGFPVKEGKAMRRTAEKAAIPMVTLRFTDVPFGTYAVTLFHDVNNNNKLDTNWIGIPKEPVAVSNNAKGKLGPPKFKDAKFDLHEPTKQISIQLVKMKS
jgi:uncharacterized protein (DUF2141 family)